jgi:uncharacterized membrane protein
VRAVYLTSVWVHIVAAATLVGGMVSFVLVFLPFSRTLDANARRAALTDFGRRFRVLTWTTFGVLVVTGLLNMWFRGVRPDDFLSGEWRSTIFGHLVIVKLLLATTLAGLCVAHDRTRSPVRAKWYGRFALVVIFLIVAAAVELVRGV